MEENYDLADHPEWIPTKEQEEAGITVSDLMREDPPPEEEQETLEECWPVDEYGLKIPMDEWTVSDLGMFPDSLKDELIAEILKFHKGEEIPSVKLLREMDPSEIRQDPRWANYVMGRIVSGMDIRPEYRG